MTEVQYFNLCEKYVNGLCSSEEESLIHSYQQENGLVDLILSADDENILREKLSARLKQSIKEQDKNLSRFKSAMWKYLAPMAAMLLFAIYLSSNLFSNVEKPSALAAKTSSKQVSDFFPNSSNAVLTLSSGEKIELDRSKNGIINVHGNTTISKSDNGLTVSKQGGDKNISTELMNTISVPRGGKFDVTLPDGTRVWLNSSSSLSFPTAFAGKVRQVRLKGEGYFEVAKNKEKPFKIDVAGKQEVEVLGTHFNISAFDNDNSISTTLLEGSVSVNVNQTQTLIKPGETAVNNLNDKIKVVRADLDEVMAWKNDMFIFNNENITSIMKKISRWYNVDIEYRGDMHNVNFEGNYSRSKGLKSLLKNIALTDKVRFEIAERRVIVIAN